MSEAIQIMPGAYYFAPVNIAPEIVGEDWRKFTKKVDDFEKLLQEQGDGEIGSESPHE